MTTTAATNQIAIYANCKASCDMSVPKKPVTANQTYILDIIPITPPRNRIQAVTFAKTLNNFAISILLKIVVFDLSLRFI